MLFTKLLTNLVEQAIEQNHRGQMPNDPTLEEARLFKRS
jgi:hypothetical protein